MPAAPFASSPLHDLRRRLCWVRAPSSLDAFAVNALACACLFNRAGSRNAVSTAPALC